MINPFAEVDWNPGTAGRRTFGKSLMIGFPILGAVLLLIRWYATGAWPHWPLWMAGIGFAVGLLCWAVPAVAKPFYLFWYGLGCSIGIVVANLIISLIYYVVVTPIGLLVRAMGKDALERRFQPQAASYWKDAPPQPDKKQYFRQF